MQFMETSAKANTNINEAFEALAKLMIKFTSENNIPQKKDTMVLKASSGQDLKTKRKCC